MRAMANNAHPGTNTIPNSSGDGSRLPTLPSVNLSGFEDLEFLTATSSARGDAQRSFASNINSGGDQASPHQPNAGQNYPKTRLEQVTRRRTLTRPERSHADPMSPTDHRIRDAFFGSLSLSRSRRKSTSQRKDQTKKIVKRTPWVVASWVLTCCLPSFFLKHCLGKKDELVRQAYREKVALCILIAAMMGIVGFLTFGFQNLACPTYHTASTHIRYQDITQGSNQFAIHGYVWSLLPGQQHPPVQAAGSLRSSFLNLWESSEITFLFPPARGVGACAGLDAQLYPLFPCTATYVQTGSRLWPNQTLVTPGANKTALATSGCHPGGYEPSAGGILGLQGALTYTYHDVSDASTTQGRLYMIWSTNVLDVSPFFDPTSNSSLVLGPKVRDIVQKHIGKDSSYAFAVAGLEKEAQCLTDYMKIASLDTITPACLASTVLVWISLMIILLVVLAKFILALYFTYVIGWRLGNNRAYRRAMEDLRRRKDEYSHKRPSASARPELIGGRSSISGAVSSSGDSNDGTASDAGSILLGSRAQSTRVAAQRRESARDLVDASRSWNANFGFMDIEPPPLDAETMKLLNDPTLMHCIAMVPCYSEGRDSLKATLDSIAHSYYPSTHKVLFVIADGIVKGSDNSMSTPDILIDMIEVDERFRKDDPRWGGDPEAFSYVAIADGANRKNFAKVYAGWYKYDGELETEASKKKWGGLGKRNPSSSSLDADGVDAYAKTMKQRKAGRVPMLLVVKCGNEEERDPAKPAAKPGNRGKRDSQVILMNFLCKVMFDDRMTELEFDIFFKLFTITGVNPEKYECVLMVDADTRVYPDSLSHMVACLIRDDRVMGLCGETKILNKWQSWVTMIQVFEYFISHHLSKSFESVFGGVTCLPGCFSMYRIKSPKGPNGYWVPILANPDVCEEYAEHIVDTLHKKNLLLLGEDRFLSTMMLRQFPKRRMVFVPQAVCKTVVPDTFKVLLSQRRRWINSTIHNLMELLLVKDLCGTFCISMQFIIFMDLVGTVVLPAAIAFTFTIIILTVTQTGADTTLPLILLALILGLPAVLILMTANRPIYIFWMLVYLLSLPVWNFVLPLYAFWHFDDFSWGATRKVTGEDVRHDHSAREGEFDGKGINMKRWSEWVQIIRAEHERQLLRGAMPFARPGFVSNGSLHSVESGGLQWGPGDGNANGNRIIWTSGTAAPSMGMFGPFGSPLVGPPMPPGMPPSGIMLPLGVPSGGILPPMGVPSGGVIPPSLSIPNGVPLTSTSYKSSPLRASQTDLDDVAMDTNGS